MKPGNRDKNLIPLTAIVILGLISLFIFIIFYDHAFPFASIEINLDRDSALKLSSDYITGQGFELDGFDKTIVFDSHAYGCVYLQKTQGIKKLSYFAKEGVPIWLWKATWFKELQKEGFILKIDPLSGKVIAFHHKILDKSAGKDLNQEEALALARKHLVAQGISLLNYDLIEKKVKKQPNRTDHSFVWEKKDFKIADATYRIRVKVQGDKLGIYERYLKVPELFIRKMKQEISLGQMLSLVARIFKYLLIIIAIASLFFKKKTIEINWKFWFCSACFVLALEIIYFFNSIPLLWNLYQDTMSKGVFFMTIFGNHLMAALARSAMIFTCGALGELFFRNFNAVKANFKECLSMGARQQTSLQTTVIVGYSLAFIFLAYLTLFYLIGTNFFNIWVSPKTEYANFLGMSLPFLFPLTIAIKAAISEEFTFRFFAISFLRKHIRYTWLVLFITALIWGFAHSLYHVFPIYIRGIELTIFGIVFGVVFLRYGLASVVIAHFAVNAILAGLPLLRSQNPYFIISGFMVVILALAPIFIIMILNRTKDKLKKI